MTIAHPLDIPLGAGLAVTIDGLEHARDKPSFLFGQFRAPNIEEKYHTRLVALVPGLVLHGIVENPGLAFLPVADVVAYTENAVVRNDQRQVANQPRVGDPGVRGNAGVRRKQLKHHIG